jgi:aspartate/glutamate racemase
MHRWGLLNMKRIGCFHAHYSNIEHVEKALSLYEVELIHFVDPGLDRIKLDANFTMEMVEQKVIEMLDWIAQCHVDAILITCTFFTAVFNEEVHRYPIPIIKIDEPLFADICKINRPILLGFTNPNTVSGTMNQLIAYSKKMGKEIEAEAFLLEGTFELIMQGKKTEYIQAVSEGLLNIALKNPEKSVAIAQLSMVPAAQLIEKQTNIFIGNHLGSLSSYMEEALALVPKS